MQEKKFSEMTEYELRQAIADLNEKARKAEQLGMVNEFAVHKRRAVMAKAYTLDPAEIMVGEIYGIDGAPGEYFKVDYLKGVFAWGYRLHQNEEEGLPISLLLKLK